MSVKAGQAHPAGDAVGDDGSLGPTVAVARWPEGVVLHGQMTGQPSDYVFGGNEVARLEAVEELLDPGSKRLLAEAGMGPGTRFLEVGAGGGSIASWASELVGPSGRVVATDVDVRFLAPLRQAENIEVREHDVVHDALEEGSFDVVHARLVLEHVAQRDAVVANLARAVRPGGWLVLEDVDYVSGVPVSKLGAEEHAHTQSVRLREFARAGVDHHFGRALPALLRECGMTDVGNEGRVWVMEGGSPAARWFRLSMIHLRDRLTRTGDVSDAQVDRMLDLFEDPDWSAFTPIFLAAWGRRPSPSSGPT
jgi:SAM-dependent methyltransferase